MILTNLLKKIVSILPKDTQRSIYWHKNNYTRSKKIKKWESIGKPVPPPHQYKQLVVEQTAKKNNLKCLVETGTFKGQMIEAQKNNFKELFSIEIDQQLFIDAKKYFKPYNHIKIFQGDSSIKLHEILGILSKESILFWLDGHYSGGNTGMGEKQCPIYEELNAIFYWGGTKKYILIDDAHCFNGSNDYPSIKELAEFVQLKEKGLTVEVLNDIINIY